MIKNMFNGRKKLSFYIIILGVLLLSITLGSALLSSTLKIMGNSAIRKSSWIIYFDDIDIAEDSAPVDNSNDNARISKNGVADPTKQNIEFTASLKEPGDFYEFTVYTVNDGSIDAEVESLEKSILTPEQQKYLEFNVTYDDGTPIKECDILYHKGSEEGPNKRLVKAVVKYKSGLDINDYPTEGVNLNLYFKINYSQNVSCEKPTEESLYKLTIRPNGGKYEGRTAQIRKYLTEGEEYVLSRPTRNLYNFDGWDVIDPDTGGTYHLEPYEDKYKFTMGSEDVIISAKWKDGDYVARIMDHYFTKVELAFDAVDGNDPSTGRPWENNTVWLLKDTEEVALNNARSSFTFNLDGHTLTGKIVNPTTGKITLVDGRIQGSSTVEASEKQRRIDEGKTAVPSINGISGEAVLNYGNLTLGINDGIVEVDNSISLLGSDYGVYNVSGSKMNFYDGYVDSMNAMTGISSQLNNGDIKIPTNYFIFVDHRTQGNDIYQKVYLTPTPNRAVAKTTTVIDTYYYNLQDAIETVTETKKVNNSLTDNDYKIEAIRTFEAAYDLNVENDSRIFIDMKGYNVQIGENVTNNGYLKIYNSKNITSDVKLSRSITNNGLLEINKVNVPISTDADGIINSGSLKLVDTIMNSHGGYCVKNIENGTLDFNENVVLRSVHKNGDVNQEDLADNYALYNSGTKAIVNGGTIYGLVNEGTITLDGESLNLVPFRKYTQYSGIQYNKAIYNKGNLTMNDGTITFDQDTPMITNIGTFTYNGGTISSIYTAIDNAENYDRGTLYVKGSEISSDNITVRHGTVYVDGGTIRTSSTKGITDATVNVISGSVVAENGVAIGEKCTVNVSGGTITGTTVGVDTDTLNMTGGTINGTVGVNVITANISGGTINGATNGMLVEKITMDGGTINSTEGVGLTVKNEGTITGGEIYGSTYGVLNKNTLTIGSDDGTISSTSPLLEGELFGLYIEGDTTNFYDGILKGQQDGYNGTITGTPLGGVVGEGTENRENDVVYQTDFVTNFEGWLRIGDVKYNSLNDATNAVGENETVTIIVTRNADITFKQELIDANKNKNITLDLNGHRVTTTQNITNNTNLTIVDSSEGTDRYLDTGTGPGTLVIQKNDGVVNLAKIIVNGGRYESTTEQVFFNKAIDSNASDVGSFDLGIEVNKATFNVSNTTIRNGIYINDTHIGGYLRVNGIKVESATNGIYNDVGKVVINGTKNNTTGKYTTDITGSNYGVRNESHLVVNGGYIHSDVRAISGDYNGLTVNEAKNINLDDDNQVASTKISAVEDHAIYSYWSNMTINGGTITSENTTAVLGHHRITINGGSITGKRGVKSEEWCTYGGCTYEPIIITGGTIIGTQYEGVYSSGTKSYELTVTGGYILGQTDGIYSRSHATIGTKGETLSTESPEIRGVEGYGFNNDNGELLFYDGILKGKRKTGFDNASHNGMIRTVEDATMVKRDYEYINNVYYETEYLVSQGDWLEIEGKGKYNTVDKACEAASNGDTIKVIADTHIAFPQTCERNKTITFDLQDYSVSFTEPITFKSKTTLTGTGSLNNLRTDMIILEDDSTILSGTYTSIGGIALTNKKVLNITGGTFESTNKNTITNSGTITYNDIDDTSSITSTEKYAVYNSGTFTLKKGNIISYGGIDNRGMLTIQDGRVEGLHTYSINSTDGNTYIEGGEIVNNVGVSVTVLCDANLTVSGTAKISSSVSNAITNNGNTGDYCDRSKLYVRGGEIVGKTMGITNSGFAYLEVTGGHIVGEETNGVSINTNNVKITGGVIEGGVYGVYTTENTLYPRQVNIGENDGNVSIDSPVLKGGSYGLYIDKGEVNFYDGILKGQVDGYSGQITNIADRTELYYDSETIDGLDYDTVYLLVESVIARNINKPSGELSYTEYTNLQDAFDEASNGDTIVLVANAPMYYPLTNEKDIELDMAGYTISTNKKITNNGELVIKNTSNEVSTIKTSSPLNLITNNNILTINNINIKNTSASNFVIKNLSKLTLTNSDIDCINGIDSNSELSIVNSTISATKNAINNSGKLNINQGTYTGGNYSIYSNSTGNTTIDSVTLNGVYYNYGNNTSTVSNSTINNELQNKDSNLTVSNSEFKDSISNNGTLTINESIFNGNIGDTINNSTTGTMNINDSTINIKSSSGHNIVHFVGITNANRMTITNTTINHDKDYIDRSYIDTIENSGTLNINGTSRLVLGNLSKKDGSYAVLRATGGTATLDFDTVTVTKPNNTTEVVPNIDVIGSATNYGIYLDSEDAKVILKQGFVSATKASNTYGVYISNGDYTQGTYDGSGLETADVSRENPKIYSIGSNKGIGIKKLNGQLNFYDGIVYGSKYAKPDTTTKVEKNYEVTTYVDSDTGYEYAWLEYMPDDYIGSDLVASITRDLNTTNYSSLTEALQFASPGDEITLLKSTVENITINQSKIVKINLNGRSLTGKITNNGILSIYNGSVQNFEDTTIVNNGELVMGQIEAPVSSTNIRIISEVKALDQKGTLTMYDGYIEGNPAMSGEINEIAEFSRIYTITDNQSEKIFLQSLDETSIRERETALLLTIDPIGGYYDGYKGAKTTGVYFGDTIKIKDPIKGGCTFLGWDTTGDITLVPIEEGTEDYDKGYRYQFTVGVKDITLTAQWQVSNEAVAKIGEDYFVSVEDAIVAAKEGDTIELIKDVTTDHITNDKDIILDLKGYKLTTELINIGVLRVIDGTIENPNGIGIWNKKTLIIGENDIETPSLDSVKIIGTNIGIKNDGGLKFYDGYIEGEVALVGDVEAVPQGYYLYIEHNAERQCQREYLIGNPQNAVAITKNDSGEESTVQYFFSLQDAIDSASITGKEIFIIKTVPATYSLEVKEGKNVVINLNGNNIQLGNTFTNNGTLKLYDT